MINRRISKAVKVGKIIIGGDHAIAVQSMGNTPMHDADAVIAQLKSFKEAGCAIARLAIPDKEAIPMFAKAVSAVDMPIVADIHFDYRLAIEAVAAGAAKIRINPGNIGSEDRVKQVVAACKAAGVPIRIGVNGGSLEKHILAKYGAPCPEAMAESADYHIKLLEKFDFDDIVISVKSSNVPDMIKAYQLVAAMCSYPLHLGVTEAGTYRMGLVKSSIGIGSLLAEGIGDTIRVSLTDDPIEEVKAGYLILKALGLYRHGVEIISCPTCGRTKIDLISLAREVEDKLSGIDKPIKVAVMGCAVNGPGEARHADIGVAGGDGEGLIFKKGEIIAKVPQDKIVERLLEEIKSL